jgi:hypothetical protein
LVFVVVRNIAPPIRCKTIEFIEQNAPETVRCTRTL